MPSCSLHKLPKCVIGKSFSLLAVTPPFGSSHTVTSLETITAILVPVSRSYADHGSKAYLVKIALMDGCQSKGHMFAVKSIECMDTRVLNVEL